MPAYPGRPREFTHKKREELINHIAQGASVEEAAQIVGVTLRTVQREAKHNEFFHHDLQLALHSAPPDPHVLMQRAARTHWRAAAWLLERTDPDKFAKRPPNSCSPETLMDVGDWLIEKALEATPPEQREAMYRHLRTAADKALDMIMPDKHIARRGMTGALAAQPTPLSSQAFVKTIPVLPDRDASRQSLLETAPPSSGPAKEHIGPPPVPMWFPSNGFKRQDSDAMDSAEHFLTPEEEEAWANAAARKKSQSDKSRRDESNRNNFTKAARPSSPPWVAPQGVESPPIEKPRKPAATGAAPPAPPDGGIMSPEMSAATEPLAAQFGGTTVSPACEVVPAPAEHHASATLLARFRAKRQEAPSQRAA
jgi:hypothetical protein